MFVGMITLGFVALFLELNKKTGKADFLHLARQIGDNILANRFHKGFFVASRKHINSKLDTIDTLVLLHLYSVIGSDVKSPPIV